VILVTGNPDIATANGGGGVRRVPIPDQAGDERPLDQVVARAATAGRMARVKREYVEGVWQRDISRRRPRWDSAKLERVSGFAVDRVSTDLRRTAQTCSRTRR